MTPHRFQSPPYDVTTIDAYCRSYRHGGPLERPFYVSEDIYHAELDRIWGRHWLYAGHSCRIPAAGDWFRFQLADFDLIIVRGRDLQVRAFHNTCRHRGSAICAEATGHSATFVCPYHRWTYDLDGSLRTQTQQEFGVDPGGLGLRPAPLRDVAGLIFVALCDDPVDFEAGAEEIAQKMRHQGLDSAKLAKSISYTVKANWKLVFENNRECLHCATSHPEYIKGTYDVDLLSPQAQAEAVHQTELADARFRAMGLDGAIAVSNMTGAYWRCTRAPLMAGWKTESLDGRPVAPLMGTMRERATWSDGTLRTTVFPNFWQHANDDHAVATRVLPIDAKTTQVEVSWYVHKDAEENVDYQLDRMLPFWQRTSEQDWQLCEANQSGVNSPAYQPGPYSLTREANVQNFVNWYLGALSSGPSKPAQLDAADNENLGRVHA